MRKLGLIEGSAFSGTCQEKKLRSQHLASVWTHEVLLLQDQGVDFIERHEIRGEQTNIL